jgi:general secretion pathway protein K
MFGGLQHTEFFEEAEDEKGNRLDQITVCSALIDWVDPNTDRDPCQPRNETASSSAPEDSYYQTLDRPYRRKNAAFDSLEELHMVMGVSDELYSRFFFPDIDDEKSRVVTVWGAGKINVNSANAQTLLAHVCHQAKPETPLCNDPAMQAKYLMTSQMFAGAMAGIPIFKSGKDFVSAIQGKGMFGQVLQSVGITPVALLAPKLMEESVTVESQVFSIYATGYVKAGKRQTRSRVHAVIDMRGAPPPGTAKIQAKLMQIQRLETDSVRAGKLSEGGLGKLPDGYEEGGIAPALLPSPGGSILYYRVD